MNGANGGRAVPKKAAAAAQATPQRAAAAPPKASGASSGGGAARLGGASSGGGATRLGAKVVAPPASERPSVQAPRPRQHRSNTTGGGSASFSASGAPKAGIAASSSGGPPGVSREAMLEAALRRQAGATTPFGQETEGSRSNMDDPFLAESFIPDPVVPKPNRSQRPSREPIDVALAEGVTSPTRQGSRQGSKERLASPRTASIELAAAVPKAPPARKKGGAAKKRKAHGAALTRPQPFSFTTDTRRGRRPVDEDHERKGTLQRERSNTGDLQMRHAQKFLSAVQNAAAGMGMAHGTSDNNSLGASPQQDGSPRYRTDSWNEDTVGAQTGGASSSTDHWEPMSPPDSIASSAPSQALGASVIHAATSGAITAAIAASSGASSMPVRRHSERHSLRGAAAQAANPQEDAHIVVSSTATTASSTVMRSRQFERPSHLHVPAKEVKDMIVCGSTETSSPNSSPICENFCTGNGYWGPTVNTQGHSPRFQRRPRIASSSPQVGLRLEKDENNSSSSSLAQLAPDDEAGSSSSKTELANSGPERSADRSRSTSIIRQSLGSHLARAPAHASNDPEPEHHNRHVSFCADRAGGVEVVQFSVDEGPAPVTTRGPRPVFGGELQSHIPGGQRVLVDMRNSGATAHPTAAHGNLERLAPNLARSHVEVSPRMPR